MDQEETHLIFHKTLGARDSNNANLLCAHRCDPVDGAGNDGKDEGDAAGGSDDGERRLGN